MNKALYIVSLLLIATGLYAQTDGTQYPINDPRNPNCPCHKLQQLAEQEYRQLQQRDNVGNVDRVEAKQSRERGWMNGDGQQDINAIQVQPLPNIQVQNIVVQNEGVNIAKATEVGGGRPTVHLSKPQLPELSSSSGSSGNYHVKKYYWRKKAFKMNKRLKKLFKGKRKPKFRLEECFSW